jgi:SSS family transporter
MNSLSAVDVAIVVLYLAGTTLIGAWFSRRQRDLKTYFVGGRDVGWGLVLVSIVATETSTVTFLSVPGLSFKNGGNCTFLQLAVGYIIGRLAIAWLLLPQYFRGECFSAYELLRDRFGPAVQRVASATFIVTRTIADGLRLFLTALLLRQFTGWDMTMSVLVMGSATIVYTYLGGMQAVIWTDLIQFVIYIVGAIVAALFIINAVPGGFEAVRSIGEGAGKFQIIDTTPTFSNYLVLWAGVIGGAFFSMASHGADQIMVQRYLCARSVGQARAALILSGVVVFVQFALFLFIGIGLYALHMTGGLELEPGTRNDEVFGVFIVRDLPVGMVGLVIAAVLAAAMSTLSSSLNSSATALQSDFYRPLVRSRSERHYLVMSKWMTAIFGVAQMGVAIAAVRLQSDQSVVVQVLSVAGLTIGLILGVFLIGAFRLSVAPRAVLVGLLVGLATVLTVWALSEFRQHLPEPWNRFQLAWPWFAPLGALTTFGVALLANVYWKGHGSSVDRGEKRGVA